ncbi:hypothetical protein HJC23_011295 [Cyclotella cryptica]|uniref:Ubiquinone biosynthesis protein n=1 Tax=Cyclotella cryptica TaxID=29204 RepID=A0ABD3QVW9_9STRA|eukprot:CCRYP_001687-RA/>CCRYP_001687-RA protein AED:0.00 eAED:0.00 QI:130/-1/1/1/-1/1/1/1280/407
MASSLSRRRLGSYSRCLSTNILSSPKHQHLTTTSRCLRIQPRLPNASCHIATTSLPHFTNKGIEHTSPIHVTTNLPSSPTRNQSTLTKDHRPLILSHSLSHVHSEGWTDDAIACGTLDAGFPPSYIGRAQSSTSLFGSADLVAFFMERSNDELREELDRRKKIESTTDEDIDIATRLHRALQFRLSAVLPFVSSRRWHEGMAIGALPQNVHRTARQLEDMSQIVLDYALCKTENSPAVGSAQRAIVVAAYAAAELHLVSEGMSDAARGVSGSSISYTGERYNSTWAFLRERCDEASRLLANDNGGVLPSMIQSASGISFNPTHLAAASAVASSLVGAAFSLAAPAAAAVAGQALPRVMDTLSPLQQYAFKSGGENRSGTSPDDYRVEYLPPFDAAEVIFPEGDRKTT